MRIKYSEQISLLDKDIILLNWNYSATPAQKNFKLIDDCGFNQIACPGTVSWNRFVENIIDSEKNIKNIAMFAKECNAMGMLTTNWGDCGHICSFNNSLYGLMLGAQFSWQPDFVITEEFEKSASSLIYGIDSVNIINVIHQMSECELPFHWYQMIMWYSQRVMQHQNFSFDVEPNDIIANLNKVYSVREKLSQLDGNNPRISDLILACGGIEILIRLYLCIEKIENYCNVNELSELCDSWFEDYKISWLRDNKVSELYRIKEFLDNMIFELKNR